MMRKPYECFALFVTAIMFICYLCTLYYTVMCGGDGVLLGDLPCEGWGVHYDIMELGRWVSLFYYIEPP